MSLDYFKDLVAEAAFGITKREAHALDICIACKELWWKRTHTKAGADEYRLSGLCENCFDRITGPDDRPDPALRRKGE